MYGSRVRSPHLPSRRSWPRRTSKMTWRLSLNPSHGSLTSRSRPFAVRDSSLACGDRFLFEFVKWRAAGSGFDVEFQDHFLADQVVRFAGINDIEIEPV